MSYPGFARLRRADGSVYRCDKAGDTQPNMKKENRMGGGMSSVEGERIMGHSKRIPRSKTSIVPLLPSPGRLLAEPPQRCVFDNLRV
jgi:hypothetical protein